MVTNMWAYESVFYQIYPMGFCGVPFENDGIQRHEIKRVEEWIPHMQKLGVNAVYFSPVFESDTHGYNTRDYRKIDVRLGTNEDFKEVCDALHAAGIRVVLDGVFNHVGRGFAQFQDVIKKRENSPYVNWFYRIDSGVYRVVDIICYINSAGIGGISRCKDILRNGVVMPVITKLGNRICRKNYSAVRAVAGRAFVPRHIYVAECACGYIR